VFVGLVSFRPMPCGGAGRRGGGGGPPPSLDRAGGCGFNFQGLHDCGYLRFRNDLDISN
jgi:hypothetical protein